MSTPLLGVLGGMGPLAAVDFARKLLALNKVETEQQHIPTLLWNVPQIPDRQLALSRGGPSPLPAMLHGIAVLNAAGATRIAIPCNTAHHWFDELDELFMPGCYAIKHGKIVEGGLLLEAAAQRLLARGAPRLVLACTEIATGLDSINSPLLAASVDTNAALAHACLQYWREQSK